MEEYIISVDWGTSFLRLKLYDISNNTILANFEATEGIAYTHNNWEKESEKYTKLEFFQHILAGHILSLSKKIGEPISDIPLVISGMTSSSIGMQELPYEALPFSFENPNLGYAFMEPNAILPHPVWLISGINDTDDVMRGEEVQLLGLSTLIDLMSNDTTVVILPGTHSKHCYIKNKEMFHFQTYITGELFKLLSDYSILKNSIDTNSLSELNPVLISAFRKGVLQSKSGSLMADLFKIRTNSLLHNVPKESNAFYMSGILIGYELVDLLRNEAISKIVLCCDGSLNELYKIALSELGLEPLLQETEIGILSQATLAGQVLCFNKLSKIENNYA